MFVFSLNVRFRPRLWPDKQGNDRRLPANCGQPAIKAISNPNPARATELDYSEVYFALYGKDFDPSVALNLIDVDSAAIQKQGDPTPKYSTWRCTSRKLGLDVLNLDQVASDLVDKLKPHRDSILALRQNHELKAVLEVVVTFPSDEARSTPAIGFDKDVIEFLQYVGATIDVDSYVS